MARENGVLRYCATGTSGGKAEEEAVRELIEDGNWKHEAITGSDSANHPFFIGSKNLERIFGSTSAS